MAKIAPVHSKNSRTHTTLYQPVFHDDDACKRLGRIKKENLTPGTGNRVKCDCCKDLSG